MRRPNAFCSLALLAVLPCCAPQHAPAAPAVPTAAAVPAATPVTATDQWQIVRLGGQEAGYVHTVGRTVATAAGEPDHETTVDTLFRMKRMDAPVEISLSAATIEDAAGQVRRLRQVVRMAKNETVYDGQVAGDRLEFTTASIGRPRTSSIPWPADVPGPRELERRARATGFRAGATFAFDAFDFSIGMPVRMRCTVETTETVDVAGVSRELHRITTRSESEDFPIPEVTSWVDDQGVALRTSTSMMGLEIVSEEVAAERIEEFLESAGEGAEVFAQSTITATVRLPRPRELTSVTYHVRARRPDDVLPVLADERQQVVSGDPRRDVLLRVVTRVPPADHGQRAPLQDASAELAEYLEPNAMLQSDDPALIQLAREGIGEETDAWRAAVRLERRVHDTIEKKSLSVAFASALEVSRTREGDCSEHAVLLAALCRAAGIPSRVAMGLVYVGGIFGGHAWTEVSIDGTWYALDGTIGSGSVDPTHLRFGVTSLKDGGLSAGLFGILKGLGVIDLEIIEYAHGGPPVRVGQGGTSARVADGRFRDPAEGVGFSLPKGWQLKPADPDLLAMGNARTIARLAAETSTTTIEVTAHGPDWSLEEWRRSQQAPQVTFIPRQLGGAPGLVASRTGAGGSLTRTAAAKVGEVGIVVQATDLDDAGFAAFEEVVGSLEVGGTRDSR